jgi:GDPmannose 4,6-dehydratase
MWLMLQADEPSDYVVATGELHSVRELVDCAFTRAGLDYRELVRTDERLVRGNAELHRLVGDPAKARERLGWAQSVDFEALVGLLVDSDAKQVALVAETAREE